MVYYSGDNPPSLRFGEASNNFLAGFFLRCVGGVFGGAPGARRGMVLAGHQLHELGSIDAMHFDQTLGQSRQVEAVCRRELAVKKGSSFTGSRMHLGIISRCSVNLIMQTGGL